MLKVHAHIARLVKRKSTRRTSEVPIIDSRASLESRCAAADLLPWEWVDASHAWGVIFGSPGADPHGPWVPPTVDDDAPLAIELTPLGWAA